MIGYDPQLLATFLAVEQTGSFTRAAARLGIRQPTVSQHIRRLEQQVGRTLVLRDTHSVSLTADESGNRPEPPLLFGSGPPERWHGTRIPASFR